jgi:hypothetical protein
VIRIRIVKEPKEIRERARKKANCKISKREIEQEYKKKGKINVPVEKMTVTQECDIV